MPGPKIGAPPSSESHTGTVTRDSAGRVTGGFGVDQIVRDSAGRVVSYHEDGVTRTVSYVNGLVSGVS